MKSSSRFLTISVCLGAVAFFAPVRADDTADKIKDGIATGLENASTKLAENFSKIIDDNIQALREQQTLQLEERDEKVAKLVDEVKNLRKQLADVQAALEAARLEKKAEKPVELTKAFLGVDFAAPAEDVRAKLKLKEDVGAQIAAVFPNGPAEKAGLKVGDVIVAVAGKEVGAENLVTAIRTPKPGEKLEIVALRGEEKVDADVALGNRDDELARAAKLADLPTETVEVTGAAEKGAAKLIPTNQGTPPAPKPARLGVSLIDEAGKVKIVAVRADSAASAFGLKEDDILLSINGEDVGSVAGVVARLTGKISGDTLDDVVVRRGDEPIQLKEVQLGGDGDVVKAPADFKPIVAKVQAKGYLGFQTEASTDDGVVLVKGVVGGGPADGKLKEDDVLVKVNGVEVKNLDDDALNALAGKFAGDTATLTVRRGDKEFDLTLTYSAVPK